MIFAAGGCGRLEMVSVGHWERRTRILPHIYMYLPQSFPIPDYISFSRQWAVYAPFSRMRLRYWEVVPTLVHQCPKAEIGRWAVVALGWIGDVVLPNY